MTDTDTDETPKREDMGAPTVRKQGGGLFSIGGKPAASTGRRNNQVLTYGAVIGVVIIAGLFLLPHDQLGGQRQNDQDKNAQFARPADAATLPPRSGDSGAPGNVAGDPAAAGSAVDRLNKMTDRFNDDGTVKPDGSNLGPAGQKIGGPVTTTTGTQPAQPTAPPLTPAQKLALARADALANAPSQSTHILGGDAVVMRGSAIDPQGQASSPPDVQPSSVPPSQVSYAGPQFAHDGVTPTQFATGSGYDQTVGNPPPASQNESIVGGYQRHRRPSAYSMDALTVLPIVFDFGYSSDTGGLISAHIAWNMMDSGKNCVVLPYWTRVVGRGDPISGNASKIPGTLEFFIYPDHSWSSFPGAILSDLNGTTGITPTSRNDHRGAVIGTGLITATLSAIPLALCGGTPAGQIGNVVSQVSVGQSLCQSIAAGIADRGTQLTQNKMNQPVTLEANPNKIYGLTLEKTIPFDQCYQSWDSQQ